LAPVGLVKDASGALLSRLDAVPADALLIELTADNTNSDADKQPSNKGNRRHFASLPDSCARFSKNITKWCDRRIKV
jgi:hypothetical protein